ncbi:MAG: hypothetical protein JWQ43_1470 [Glaciihabitans sp.]|nr:hypothetical protein [Glaciihabitans sp.]
MSGLDASTWSLDIALPDWIAVPSDSADVAEWRAEAHNLFITLAEIDARVAAEMDEVMPGDPLDIDYTLAMLVDVAATLPPNHRLVAGLAIPQWWPLPVIVSVQPQTEESGDLLDVSGARGGLPINAPTVEHLPEELGDGIRVTRYDLDEDMTVWATVTCTTRRNGLDALVTWRTTDLELVPVFSPELEELLARIRLS